jgi:hypothetical protein
MNFKILFFTLITVFVLRAQEANKVVLITLDGYRWQELFTGADAALISNVDYVHHPDQLVELFWSESAEQRRSLLTPFIWSTIRDQGQLHGNRWLGSKVNLTNSMWFSYPGYNEILTGRADDERIRSNDKIPNPNVTVLEQFVRERGASHKVAAFGSWDVFDYITNEPRSKVYTNSGFDLSSDLPLTEREEVLNELQPQIPSPWSSVRLDGFTHQFAKEYLKKQHPDLIYIAYGETDDFAHDGDYEAYLKAAHNTDKLIEDLWNFTQRDSYYSGKTTFIITTDHGRGTWPLDLWRGHGSDFIGADQTWLIVFGAKVAAKGEIKEQEQLFTNQVAPTVRMLLGLKQETGSGYGSPIELE